MSATASQTKSLHLLRALLREVSYLPDLTARNYFRRYVVGRFKAYQPKSNATASFDVHAVDKYRHRSFRRRHTAIIDERAGQQQRKAQKGLNFLRRANQGEGPCLQKVLWFAYGRQGRRKHALLHDLLKPDPAWSGEPAPLQKLYRSNLRCLQYFDAPATRNGVKAMHISAQYPRLKALIVSQRQKDLSLRRPLKSAWVKVPVLNIWQRPMPRKRVVNYIRCWYAEAMTRLLPALPADEWDRIDAMSKGLQHIEFVKKRTPVAQPPSSPTSPHTSLERMVQHTLAMDKLNKADRPQRLHQQHRLTPRVMQRMYSRLLMLTCKLQYDDTRKRWNVIWGDPPKSARSASYAVPINDALFSGVDSKGLLPPAALKNAAALPVARESSDSATDMSQFPFFAEWLPKSHPLRVELDAAKEKREVARSKLAAGGDAPDG